MKDSSVPMLVFVTGLVILGGSLFAPSVPVTWSELLVVVGVLLMMLAWIAGGLMREDNE